LSPASSGWTCSDDRSTIGINTDSSNHADQYALSNCFIMSAKVGKRLKSVQWNRQKNKSTAIDLQWTYPCSVVFRLKRFKSITKLHVILVLLNLIYFLRFFSISRVNLASVCLSKKSCFLDKILENLSKYLASISPSRIRVLDSADAAAS